MDLSLVKFDDRGLVPAIAQDVSGRGVLMLGYADAEALAATERTGFAHFFSRSRGRLWMKGETSGNRLAVVEIRLDCDGDTILYLCRPEGPTCHTGDVSCFSRTLHGGEAGAGSGMIDEIQTVLLGRLRDADAGSYSVKLLKNPALARKKVLEEAFEVALASEKNDAKNLGDEVADLWFHSLALLVGHGLTVEQVFEALKSRRGKRREPA